MRKGYSEKRNVHVRVFSLSLLIPHSQQLESTVESLKTNLQEKEEKYNKMVKTLKAARSRIDTLKTDKDQVHVHVYTIYMYMCNALYVYAQCQQLQDHD